jgi:predicted nucleotidyltransferase
MLNQSLSDILNELRQRLVQALGHQLANVILYGSYARGDAWPDSDIDVLIVVNGPLNYPDLMQRTSAHVADISLRHDVVVSRTFASTDQWETAHTPFLINIRRDGVAV